MGIMNFSIHKHSSKRMRLDLQNNFDVNVANDDLWGQEDLTAEEFDMLEVQATQETSGASSFRQPLPASVRQPLPKPLNNEISHQVDIANQQQYELEGKVKILSDSLEKLKKELSDERMKRERIISEKVQEFQQQENILLKEIEKTQSSLQFKDQEMKTVYDKVHSLELQLKERKLTKEPSTHKSPNKFLEKFNFKAEVPAQPLERQHQSSCASHKKRRLSINMPRGKIQGQDIVSSILCNRLMLSPVTTPSFISPLLPTQTEAEATPVSACQLSAMSVTRICSEQETREIFSYSCSVLKNYLTVLKNSAAASVNSPPSARKRDVNNYRETVISCLKDLSFVISCPQFSSSISKWDKEDCQLTEIKADSLRLMEWESSTSTNTSLSSEKKYGKYKKKINPLLELLFTLSNPDTYPNGYLKDEEIEWALTTLVSWSKADFKNFLDSLDGQIIISHINTCYSLTSSCIVLKLLINLCTHKAYLSKLIHNNDSCHLCAISILLLRKISASPLECVHLMNMVEDYLSSIFTMHSFSEMNLENAPCFPIVLQGFLTTLMKFYELKKSSSVTLILKKGFTLLHHLSRYIPNFKGRRIDFEDLYISLVCGMLTLSKEDPTFKEFYDLAHDLWDFQEDTSEFDLEDPSDESTPPMISQSES